MAPASAKRKKKLKKCSNTDCPELSENVVLCNDCKQPYHFICCNLNEALYDMLILSECDGLNWSWRCNTCATIFNQPRKNLPDEQIKNITGSIKNELSQEIKKQINESFKLINNRINDMETKCLPKIMTEISREVENQSNDVRSHLASYASTIKRTRRFFQNKYSG